MDDYISRKDLAATFGKNEMALIRWEKDGKGPPVTRLGRQVLYRRQAVAEWIKAQEK